MHHSKELCYTFKTMLIYPRCTSTDSSNSYGILYIAQYIPLICIHVIELKSFLNMSISSRAS